MDDKTLTALRGSIDNWTYNVANPDTMKVGAEFCPLCQEFAKGEDYVVGVGCTGCPVNDHTRGNGCNFTPISDWITVGVHGHEALASRERDFLKSLLPPVRDRGVSMATHHKEYWASQEGTE